ncbi:MarR family winged helix-turn-helix transcriptional regulator [Pokkaliibacter sp. CJK22405]|uniref:MarR family winged helix-turn-helix transcriptional regulator n=1 Tax=Pokkaliibacter sp. CJK22405 TaxID=3384615 RepID=UPI003984E616
MQNFDPLHLDNQLCFALYSTSLAMTQIYKPLLEPLGLTYPQYLIMLILWEEDGIGLKDIGARLGQKSGALTPVVKRLEADGLIKRMRALDDDRALNIQLTTKGLALKAQGREVNRCIIDACATSAEDFSQLKSQLDRLREKLSRHLES